MADQNLTLKIKVGVDGQPQVELLNQSIGKLQNTTKKTGLGFNSLADGIKAFAAAAAVGEILNYGKGVIDLGDQLQKASQKSGIAVEELAKLKVGAELADVSFESLQVGLKRLSTNLVEARGGNEKLEAAFKAAGISAKELKNINLDTALSRIADKFAATEDGANKNALATKLLGKNGSELIPLFDGGSEAMKRFSLNIGADFAKNAQTFNDNTKLMKLSLTNLSVDAIGPILKPLSSFFVNLGVEIDFVITKIRQTAAALTSLPARVFPQFASSGSKDTILNSNTQMAKLQADFDKRSAEVAKQFELLGLPEAVKIKGKLADDKGESIDKIKAEKDALSDYITKQQESIDLLQAEIDRVKMSDVDYKKLVETKKHNAETDKDSSKFTHERLAQFKEESAVFLRRKLELIDQQEEQKRTFGYGAQEAFKEYIDKANDTAALVKQAFTGAFSKMEDSLVEFVKTGKLNFTNLITYLLDEIIRFEIKRAVLSPILGAVGSVFSSPVASANGNVVGYKGAMPLAKYARGGIARSPQVSIFGEGSMPEAYVPLADGRSIPVTLKGGYKSGGSTGDTNVVVNVNVESGAQNSVANDTNAEKLGAAISNAVKREIVMQKRAGGALI